MDRSYEIVKDLGPKDLLWLSLEFKHILIVIGRVKIGSSISWGMSHNPGTNKWYSALRDDEADKKVIGLRPWDDRGDALWWSGIIMELILAGLEEEGVKSQRITFN